MVEPWAQKGPVESASSRRNLKRSNEEFLSTHSESEGEIPDQVELLADPFVTHGPNCRCRSTTTLADLPLAHSIRVNISRLVGRHPANIRVQDLLGPPVVDMPSAIRDTFLRAAGATARFGCPYDGGDSPSISWGSSSREVDMFGRWPDDWDSADWMRWWMLQEGDCVEEANALPPLRRMFRSTARCLRAASEPTAAVQETGKNTFVV